LSDAATITIAAGAGTYELRVFPAAVGGFNRIQFNNAGDKDKLLEVKNWGDVVWSTMEDAFRGCANLTSVTSFTNPNFNNVSIFSSMFQSCSSITTLDVSSFNTSNAIKIRFMFFGCSNVTTLDISGFDTSKVDDASSAFNGCSNVTTLDVSNFNTTSLVNASFMFRSCSSITTLDVSSFNTSGITNMWSMFRACTSLTDIIGVEDFDITNVTDIRQFLEGTTLPTSRYDSLLINYEAQAPQTGLNFHGGNSQYTAGGAAEAARTSLATTYSWTITDGGGV